MYRQWLIDVSMDHGDGMHCFVPVEDPGGPNEAIVYGMNLLTSIEGFNQGEIMGFVHPDGQEVVEQWCADNPAVLEELTAWKATSTPAGG